jgi:hypothetical protein
MLSPKTYFIIACAVVIAGCSDSSAIATGPTKIDQFSLAWQHPLSDSAFGLGSGHYLAFDSHNNLAVVDPHYPDSEVAQGCAAIHRFATDGTKLATLPFDKSDPPIEPFGPCASQEFIEIDGNDAIITAGVVSAHNIYGYTNDDIFVRKLDSEGKTLWTRYYQDDIGYVAYLHDIIVDAQDNILITASMGPAAMGPDPGSGWTKPWVVKYDSQGNLLWTHVIENTKAWIDNIEMDAEGNAWLDVTTEEPSGRYLARLSPEGDPLPAITVEGSLVLVSDGYLLTESDGMFRKYSTSGALLWETAINTDAYADAHGYPLRGYAAGRAVAPDGSIYGMTGGYADDCYRNAGDCMSMGIPVITLVKYSGDDGHPMGAWYYKSSIANSHVYDRIVGEDGAIAFVGHEFVGMVAPLE